MYGFNCEMDNKEEMKEGGGRKAAYMRQRDTTESYRRRNMTRDQNQGSRSNMRVPAQYMDEDAANAHATSAAGAEQAVHVHVHVYVCRYVTGLAFYAAAINAHTH